MLQERILPLRSVVISKTPMPDKATSLSKVIEVMNIKSRISKRRELPLPATHTF